MSNLSVATGRDEPCPYINNLSFLCNLVLVFACISRVILTSEFGRVAYDENMAMNTKGKRLYFSYAI
jgi:hypothetical protein